MTASSANRSSSSPSSSKAALTPSGPGRSLPAWKLPYARLLERWCRALLAHQVHGMGPGLDGGLLCPACARVHGRCADAVHPLLCQAWISGDMRYRDAAIALLDWSQAVSGDDGSWTNEISGHEWKGITVFSVIALGEALRHHGDLLNRPTCARWRERLRRGADYVHANLTIATGNINYPVAAAAALAVCSAVLGEARYANRARELAASCMEFFTAHDSIPWGEGSKQPSPRGLRAVDLGYNVEETLPNLGLYASILGDSAVLDVVERSWRVHLEFMLPDGGWDDSWGTRLAKWTWWGSRTSDGCAGGLLLFANHDATFAEAAARNLALLERCTHDGLLYGGPHHHARGFAPCIHHTFCHARSIAAALDLGVDPAANRISAPAQGVRSYPDLATWIVRRGPWRATLTASDTMNPDVLSSHPSGGSLSLLWHERTGPLLCASMAEFRLVEPSNMQTARRASDMATATPRLECDIDGTVYRTDLDIQAEVAVVDERTLEVRARLVDSRHADPATGPLRAVTTYRFSAEALEIDVRADASYAAHVRLVLPVVSLADEPLRAIAGGIELVKPGAVVTVSAINADGDAAPQPLPAGRVFNQVPGFEAVPLSYGVGRGLRLRLSVR